MPRRRPKGELPQPRPPQWRRRRPGSSARVRGRPPRGHGGQRADTPTTPTPSSPPATGMDETADMAEEWLEEEADMSPLSRRVRVRICLPELGVFRVRDRDDQVGQHGRG